MTQTAVAHCLMPCCFYFSIFVVEAPMEREADPDSRATFKDFARNMWPVGTQKNM